MVPERWQYLSVLVNTTSRNITVIVSSFHYNLWPHIKHLAKKVKNHYTTSLRNWWFSVLDHSAVMGRILREAKCQWEFTVRTSIRNKHLLSIPMEKGKGTRKERVGQRLWPTPQKIWSRNGLSNLSVLNRNEEALIPSPSRVPQTSINH